MIQIAKTWVIVCLLVFGFMAREARSAPPVGYEALADLDRLWLWTGEVRTGMSSSTDPTGGNWDMSNFHGYYQGEKVLVDLDGPGCVYRIWSARPSGMIKVYLDGEDKPEISCRFKDYLEGNCPDLTGEFALGRAANYMPICFENSIVITAPGFRVPGYYQVSYQTYDPWIQVESFRKDSAPEQAVWEAALLSWRAGPVAGVRAQQQCHGLSATPGPGETVSLELEGAGVIRSIYLMNPDRKSDPLEGVRMKLYWDGSSEPAVDVPVDAFFMNRFDLKDKWPGGALINMFVYAGPDGYISLFPMPYAAGARIELINSEAARNLQLHVRYEPRSRLPINAMRFYAEYREQDYDEDLSPDRVITMKTPIDPETNYVVLDREGSGHYIGVALFVKSVGTIWWGEGDEMTYIDDEPFPQLRGTGTEDEFNWSWGFNPHMSAVSGTLPVVPECKESIAAQLIPQLRKPECNRLTGHNVAYRLRPTDYVAFKNSLKVSYEILGASWSAPHSIFTGNLSQLRGDDYRSVAYWYENVQ